MSVYHLTQTDRVQSLFANWEETMILSCLQGLMGSIWADNPVRPESAQLIIADFCFFAGEPAAELVSNIAKEKREFVIMVPQNKEWGKLIEQIHRGHYRKVTRYAIKKEPDIFDTGRLKEITEGIRKPYRLEQMDRNLYEQAIKQQWSKDLCSSFRDYEDYKERGLGVAVTDGGVLVAGASSYTVYQNGIEIEIDTREDYRRRGLALACGAGLILECLSRGLYPSWDAQNQASVLLAEKLGYHLDKEYDAYEISYC